MANSQVELPGPIAEAIHKFISQNLKGRDPKEVAYAILCEGLQEITAKSNYEVRVPLLQKSFPAHAGKTIYIDDGVKYQTGQHQPQQGLSAAVLPVQARLGLKNERQTKREALLAFCFKHQLIAMDKDKIVIAKAAVA